MSRVTEDQAEEIRKCRDDVVYFVTNYAYLKHTTKGRIKWDKPYPYQLEALRAMQDGEDLFILKSRRIGASWVVVVFVLWLCLFFPDKTCLLLSRKEFYAKGLLKRVKFILNNLPDWMRPRIGTNTQSEISFVFRSPTQVAESNIISLTTTDESGRGEDAAFVFMDEGAFVPNGDDVWASIGPTASFGGQRAVVSTPNGTGGFFHRIVMQLQSQQPEERVFRYIEAHWKRDCGLSDEWYRRATAGLSLQKKLQEFELVFLSTGRPFFDLVKLQECYKPPDQHPEIKVRMVPTENNFSGVDTSEGHALADGRDPDYHYVTVLNELGIQCYTWYSNTMPRPQFTGHVQELDDGQKILVEGIPAKVHREYPGGMAIETLGSGDITAAMHQAPDNPKSYVVEHRPTNASKMRILNGLRNAINELQIVITDHFTYQCLTLFEDQTTGAIEKAAAADGAYDDPVIGLALAYMLLRRWGGATYDLSMLTQDGRRAIQIRQEADAKPGELQQLLPVGGTALLTGPLMDMTQVKNTDREEGWTLRNERDYRSGRRTDVRPAWMQ